MSTQVIINKFDGGQAEDVRTHATDECTYSKNFDILTNPYKLIPYADSVEETSSPNSINDVQISDVDIAVIAGTYYFTAAGNESSVSAKGTFYTKSVLANGGVLNWTSQAVCSNGSFVKNSMVVYKDQAYLITSNSGTYTLYRFNSAGSVTSIGTIASSGQLYAKPFVHPQDNILYIVIGTVIATYDGSTLNVVTTILPTGYECTSLAEYGTYLAISMRPIRGNGNSITYLWGRDITLNTLQGIVDWGEGNAPIIENINNVLFAVVQVQNLINGSTSGTRFTNALKIKAYSGGSVITIKSILVDNSSYCSSLKVKNSDRLYFGLPSNDCAYLFTKNKSGRYIITKDRYLYNGTTISVFLGLSMIGDIMWKLFSVVAGGYKLFRSKTLNFNTETATYNSTSIYRTSVNQGMTLADRSKDKQLESVQILYTGKAFGAISAKYSVDGAADKTVMVENTTAAEEVKESSAEITTGNAFNSGREYVFQVESIGGVEIKEIRYKYRILTTQI